MSTKKGEEHLIKIIPIIIISLIILAVAVLIYDALPKTEKEPDEFVQQTQPVSEPELTQKTSETTFSLPIQTKDDCVANEIFDVQQKRCIIVCNDCENDTLLLETLNSFTNSQATSIDLTKIQTVVSYTITENQTVIFEAGSNNLSGFILRERAANVSYQNELLAYVTQLYPLHIIPSLKKINIVSDGRSNTLTALKRTNDNDWELYVDIMDAFNPDLNKVKLNHELIHHFANIYFGNSNHIDKVNEVTRALSKEEQNILRKKCPNNYFSPYGCMKTGTYLNSFYLTFWKDRYDEWIEMENPKLLYSKYDGEYHKISSTTDPLSDMNNAFVYFIITDEPTVQTASDEKVAFFYQYPELLRVRDWMRANSK